ncbi:LysE family translocator [Aestuariirhabdus sp. Z084]|uniref:LysE family translocator n=1 Tax=Aestuariirhabdus haliotis TaxID=2918751 RepID=UPI00201B367D|nr:LysE family translocator [Aestuariirhabdus haliotis]MCL6417510.1 LysE family translocator [Aestuariirhabdus haliotis]MCL6421446.1 LysE family translocator [Aestuariirhabdus haliotis]
MIELSVLLVFIPTFLLVSATPGMCMTLAMTMGMTIGVRRTLWMMWGELIGVGLVSVAAVLGVAAIMLNYPALFLLLKYVGGAYLVWLGVQMWRSRGKMAITDAIEDLPHVPGRMLFLQGLVTAIANPKGWAFMVSLLPPFINPQSALLPQLSLLVGIILCSEFVCMLAYASGGRSLRHFLQKSGNVRLLNRIAGSLMMGVGIWLATG